MATAIEQRVNIKIVVLNNNSLGLVRQQQEFFYEKNHFASDFQIDLDFAAIARGFGMQAYDLTESENSEAMLAKELKSTGPILINVPIGKYEGVYPIVPPGAANNTVIGCYHAETSV